MIRTFALIAAVSTLALAATSAGAGERSGRDAFGAVTNTFPTQVAQKPKARDTSRETAIRECNAARSGYSTHGWGVRGDAIYRSCMAGRGQPE